MADKLYKRKVRLVISSPVSSNYHETTRDELEITAQRVAFKIEFKDSKEPNASEVSVYGLNKDSRAIIQKKGNKVILEAGYEDTGLSRIFIGDVRIGDNKKSVAEWISTMKLGDGERAYRNARVNQSFSPGTTAGDVLDYLADASGLQVGNVPKKLLDLTQTYDQGYSIGGKWSDEMTRFCRSVGYVWSIQHQTLQVLLPGQAVNQDGLIPELSADSGLIETPEFGTPEKKGQPFTLKFKSLLRPVQVGAVLRLKSRAHDGEVLVKKASVTGDTHGGDWYVNYEGIIHGDNQS